MWQSFLSVVPMSGRKSEIFAEFVLFAQNGTGGDHVRGGKGDKERPDAVTEGVILAGKTFLIYKLQLLLWRG